MHHPAQKLRRHKFTVQGDDATINKWWLQHLRAMPQRHLSPLMAVVLAQCPRFVPQHGIAQKRRWISEPKNVSIHKEHRLFLCLGYNRSELKPVETFLRVIRELRETGRRSRLANLLPRQDGDRRGPPGKHFRKLIRLPPVVRDDSNLRQKIPCAVQRKQTFPQHQPVRAVAYCEIGDVRSRFGCLRKNWPP
ncbi:MAG: hypothetical protein DME67_07115 [Verrucomicrobia bacterium]|nr:MAG: hypothetical protein DME67_07115 [Verrucomicrobiota bacterium]